LGTARSLQAVLSGMVEYWHVPSEALQLRFWQDWLRQVTMVPNVSAWHVPLWHVPD
jgi:hypothetical protein